MRNPRSALLLMSLLVFTALMSSAEQVGPNDFRISVMGTDGDTADRGELARSAYNATANEFLVVWLGRVGGEAEVYAQRIDAATMTEIGDQFVISDTGPIGNASFGAGAPAIAWNSTNNEYLVVWAGDDGSGSMIDNEFEIWGQRLNSTGGEIGTNDFRISDMGTTDGSTDSIGRNPDVVYNATSGEYLVVWDGEDDNVALNENEIWGQRITASTGSAVGTNDFRISEAGSAMDSTVLAGSARVAWNSTDNQYLVVWTADSLGTDNENEIFGQRLSASGGFEGSEFRISDMGPNSNADYDGSLPAIGYNSASNEYLVVWIGDDNTAPLVDGENEIFGQRISNTGGSLGTNDFRISDMGANGDIDFDAANPDVAYSASANEYLVVWTGDDSTNTEFEAFGQRIDAAGAEVGANDFRLSDMGSVDGDSTFGAFNAEVSFGPPGLSLVTFNGDDDAGDLVDQEIEVYGQFFQIEIGNPRGDFDGDGDGDIIWRNSASGENGMWLMDGASVQSAASLPTVSDLNMKIVGVADLDGDGMSDVIWRNAANGTNAAWLMNGTTVSSGALLPTIADTGLAIVGAGDFDGDGKGDILWRKSSDGTDAVWLMDGTTVSSGALLPSVSSPMEIVGVGDLDGNGKDDIVWRNLSSGENAVWLMNGSVIAGGAFLPAIVDGDMRIVGVADFSGDGKADILWRNIVTGANAMWLMNGTSIASGVVLPSADAGFAIGAVTDFDGDGKNDIAFRHGDGSNAMWLMDGASIKSGALLPTVADTNTKIAGPK